jgi:hypothetical protein
MTKNNVRAIVAESQQTFDETLANLESLIAAEVPITAADKKGMRASEMEMSKLDFIINNVDKVDPELPKNFENNIFVDSRTLLTEKKRQLSELTRIVSQIENQIAVVRIRLRPQIRIFYVASEASYKRDITLKYINVNMQECYVRKSNGDDKSGDVTNETPK